MNLDEWEHIIGIGTGIWFIWFIIEFLAIDYNSLCFEEFGNNPNPNTRFNGFLHPVPSGPNDYAGFGTPGTPETPETPGNNGTPGTTGTEFGGFGELDELDNEDTEA